jgi:hypothetical protein
VSTDSRAREAVACEEVEERCSDRRRRDEERVSKPGETRSSRNPGDEPWFRDARWRSLLNQREAELAPQPPNELADDKSHRDHSAWMTLCSADITP